jgi:hypothetical protein
VAISWKSAVGEVQKSIVLSQGACLKDGSLLFVLIDQMKSSLKGIALSKVSKQKSSGPVVKSGPNWGKNRARCEDGRWREKHSDTGKSRGGKEQGEN